MVRYNHTATLNEDQTVTITAYCIKSNDAVCVTMREEVYLAWVYGRMTTNHSAELTPSARHFLTTGIMENA